MHCWLVINGIYDGLVPNQKHPFIMSMYKHLLFVLGLVDQQLRILVPVCCYVVLYLFLFVKSLTSPCGTPIHS